MVDAVGWIRRHLTLIRSVSGLVILLATAVGVLFRILPLTGAAVLVAALPGMLSVDIPYGNACSNRGGIRRHVAVPGGLKPRDGVNSDGLW